MEMKRFLKFSFILVCLISISRARAQEADSLMKLIESKVIIDYVKYSTMRIYGSSYAIGGKLRYCISFLKQPNCDEIRPLVQRLQIIADTTNLYKLTELTRLLIKQYNFAWDDTKYRVVCIALQHKLPERWDQHEIISSLQSLRLYLLLFKNFNGDDKKVFVEVIKRLKIFHYCYDLKYERMSEMDSLACNRIESLIKRNDGLLDTISNPEDLLYLSKTSNFYFDLFERKFDDWKMNLKTEIYEGNYVDNLKPNSDTLDIDRFFLGRIIQLAIANKSSFLNDFLIRELENPTTIKFADGFFLLGTTDEQRVIPIISKCLESKPTFFDESGDYSNYILGDYGKLYSRQFFLSKLKEKLPKDKYLLAISAILRVPNQEVAELLKKEYRNQKDPYIKKAVINAIDQVYYRKHLADRPSREWFDEQRQLLTRKIEKLENTEPQDEK